MSYLSDLNTLQLIVMIAISIVLITIFVIYYLSYRKYLNQRINGLVEIKKYPYPTTVVLCLALVFCICLIASMPPHIIALKNKCIALQNQIDGTNTSDASDAFFVYGFDENSPYIQYRDACTSKSPEYKIKASDINGFKFYYAQKLDSKDTSSPLYICYFKCPNNITDDMDIIVKYYRYANGSANGSANDSASSITPSASVRVPGGLHKEVMVLGSSFESFPCKVEISVIDKGDDIDNPKKILNQAFFDLR